MENGRIGGDASKFGLTSSELLEALDFMESKGLKDCLKLIHFHIGSQVTKIRRIKTALREASQFYVQLHSMGFNVEFVDIGGGLGVDYDGTRSSNSEGSVNYSIQEYVNDSISTLVDVSDKNGIPHPNIITESGRALTAHHSVLIFEVLETATLPEWDDEEEIAPDAHELVQELYSIWDSLNQNKMLEAWHDAQQIREEALNLFSHGIVDLKTRAQIERLYWSITREINQIAGGLKHAPDEFRDCPSCWRINIFVISHCSSPCPTLGRLIRYFRLCLFSGWMRSRSVRLPCRISPVIRTERLQISFLPGMWLIICLCIV